MISPRRPTVALVSKGAESGGGASRLACQLRELLAATFQYQIDHWTGDTTPLAPCLSMRGGWLGSRLYRRTSKLSRLIGLPDFLTTEYLTHLLHRPQPYDLYHIHDISDAISPYTLAAISRSSPVVWTFHDCSPFTGGCIYPIDCRAYIGAGCTACPQLARWPLRTSIDRTRYMQRYKISLINERVSAVICPSRWIADQAVLAGVNQTLINVIPNSINTMTFAPQDKLAARRELKLPSDAPIVMVSAMDLENEFKGASFARQAFKLIAHKLYVLAVGQNSHSLVGPHETIPVNFVSSRATLAKYYSACDVLLFPSIEDNCPLALLEAMACGTPAIAFNTGGVGEIVEHDVNGWLAARSDATGLAEGLKVFLADADRQRTWGVSARTSMLEKHNHQLFLERHLALYSRVLQVPEGDYVDD